MNKFINIDSLKKSFMPLFGLMLVFPLLMTSNNFGGSGLDLSYNLPSWFTASWIIASAIFLALRNQKFNYPLNYKYLLIFPIVVLATSLGAENLDPIGWLFRQAYIFMGLLFLFSLFQFSFKNKDIEKTLYLIVISSLLYALLGIAQLIYPEVIFWWLHTHEARIPFGLFRQVNVQATFLVTGVISALYLISRPSFNSTPTSLKVLLLSSIALSNYNILVSGSRIGLLSLLVGVVVLMFSRRKQLAFKKKTMTAILILALMSTYLSQSGISQTLAKTVISTESSYSDARMSMYQIGLELVLQKPIQGHGVGSFEKIWSHQASDFLSRNPSASLPVYPSHPHNELLFWVIEGGISSFFGLLLFIFGVSAALLKCGVNRGGAYLALLIPISLHTQVELPFYISAIHWFVWLFLVFLPLSHASRTVKIGLSSMAMKSIQVTVVTIAFLISLFMLNTQRAQHDLHDFMFNLNTQPPYLEKAFENIYLRPMATQVAMRTMLHESMKNNDHQKLRLFSKWAENYVAEKPEPKIYEEWISAEFHLNEDENACSIVFKAKKLHPNHKPFIEWLDECGYAIKES
jgi:O-antigen polymerase